MKHYIAELILQDIEVMAKRQMARPSKERCSVPMHANVVLALIETYREVAKAELSK